MTVAPTPTAAKRRRKPDWLIALVMAVGGFGEMAAIGWATSLTLWGAILAGFLFWPAAVVAGVVFTRNEEVHVGG